MDFSHILLKTILREQTEPENHRKSLGGDSVTLARRCVSDELAEEDERLGVLLQKAFDDISDEEYERIGRDAFYADFISKNASDRMKAYLKEQERYTDEGEHIP